MVRDNTLKKKTKSSSASKSSDSERINGRKKEGYFLPFLDSKYPDEDLAEAWSLYHLKEDVDVSKLL